jgi:hypothetical protein
MKLTHKRRQGVVPMQDIINKRADEYVKSKRGTKLEMQSVARHEAFIAGASMALGEALEAVRGAESWADADARLQAAVQDAIRYLKVKP